MKSIGELLDDARKAQGISSDAALARAVGVTRGSISNWRSGVSLPDAVACAALAGLTGEPLARVLGIVGEARAISREEKAVWRKLAATAALVILCVVPFGQNAAAATISSAGFSAMPIMSNVAAWLERIEAWLWCMVEGHPARSALHA